MSVIVHRGMAIIEEECLSIAWARAFQLACQQPHHEIMPLTVSITGFENGDPIIEDTVHTLLDETLTGNHNQSIQTVANTIFPITLWNPDLPRSTLFERFERIWNRIQDHRQGEHQRFRPNGRGQYFHELIAYREGDQEPLNQLDRILEIWTRARAQNRRPLRQLLQAVITKPSRDLRFVPRMNFPCLHQVSFSYEENDPEGLYMTAYYPTQTLFERAYGNYLGLSRLGKFMAHEMGLTLRRVTCITGRAHIEVPVGVFRALLTQLNATVPQ